MSPGTILLIHFATRVGCLFVIHTVYINIIGCLSLKISQHFLGSNKRVSATFIQLWLSQSIEYAQKLKSRHSSHTLHTHIWTHTAPIVIHVRWTSWWQPTDSHWHRQSEKGVLCWDCLVISQLSRGPWGARVSVQAIPPNWNNSFRNDRSVLWWRWKTPSLYLLEKENCCQEMRYSQTPATTGREMC